MARARRHLHDAKQLAEVERLSYHAARQRYVAALAGAHALIFELTGKFPNTHRGAKAMVHDLSRKGHSISAEALTILDQGFDWKTTAD
jgi:uncharacterized protein (UPF0332 family)